MASATRQKGLNAKAKGASSLRFFKRDITYRLGRKGRIQWMLYSSAVVPPSPSQTLRVELLAPSVIDKSCGPEKNVFKSCTPASEERLPGSTINDILIAT